MPYSYSAICVHMCVADLQNVNITLRILFRPIADRLPDIFTNLGVDYDERVLPSIVNEVLKAVVVSTLCRHILFITRLIPLSYGAVTFSIRHLFCAFSHAMTDQHVLSLGTTRPLRYQ